MVDVRVTDIGVEVFAESPAQAAVTRYTAETVTDASGAGEVQVTDVGIEVFAKSPPKAGVTRYTAEAIADGNDGGSSEVQVTDVGIEVAAETPSTVSVTRYTAETVADSGSTSAVRVTDVGLEIMAKTGVIAPVPLPFPAGIDIFMHNWATEVEMETRYPTDITRSRATGAEERRADGDRPERVITFRWLQMTPEVADRLYVTLRRMTDENIVLPLYQDFALVTQDSSGTELFCSADTRRFYQGGRVVIVPVGPQVHLSGAYDVHSINFPLGDRLVLNTALASTKEAGRYAVAPLIDLDILLEPELDHRVQSTGETVVDLTLTCREHKGANSLPPVAFGFPAGWTVQLGKPVFEIEPDFSSGVRTQYRRYGRETRKGRKQVVFKEGTRYNQVQNFDLGFTDRQSFWEVLSFFDSRKGPLLNFWAIDREFVWTVIDTDPQFIEITPQGVFADFENIWTEQNIAAGMVFNDGSPPLIRQINTVQEIGGRWRLTLVLGQSMPIGLDVTTIERFAVARISRFDEEFLREEWQATEAGCRVRLATVETQNEKEVDVDP